MLLFGEVPKRIVISIPLFSISTIVLFNFEICKAMIKKFMTEVVWGDLDYLLIDTPPGTSDEHLAVMENIKASNYSNFSAELVNTPQVNLILFD